MKNQVKNSEEIEKQRNECPEFRRYVRDLQNMEY